ncbi:alanine dehydrogenase [Tessaracoccus oleiagri]|uniref:Alanine dehydrogenase n=1 Tax=Tessaracoccus oleiagri TaxID=686624 RepID=A0A1G9JA88_9ACTN|nr:alanine dehydrogenase [Tessaracoccus oleiagri]SDL34123.1 alanine dehydrogenase [Tessaracoccus oleiagri]
MRVGVPTEVKNNEYRVAITQAGVHALADRGHEVLIQSGAGVGSGISDEQYAGVGATIVDSAADVWGAAELVLKVKEPVPDEYELLREGTMLFTYLHLAADRRLTEELLRRKVTAIAYETVELEGGALPLLAPMSEIAGRLSTQVGAHALLKYNGGAGVLLGGATGVITGEVAVLGGGVVGLCAARVARGMGANVTVFDINVGRMRYIEEITGGTIRTEYSTPYGIKTFVENADLVIGAALIAGAKAPTLVTNEMVAGMKPGSVLVDVAIDQGGCFEDSRPTTHADPIFKVHDSVFYCVTNMPGSVPVTSTRALTNATMPYCLLLADKGWREAMRKRPELALGMATHEGALYSEPVGEAFGIEARRVERLLG